MSEKFLTAAVTIAIAIVGVAVIAVLVSQRAQTVDVITQSASGFKDALCAALSPLGINCGRGSNTGNQTGIANSTITYPGL